MNTIVLLFVVLTPKPDCITRWDQTAQTAQAIGMQPLTPRPERSVNMVGFGPGEEPVLNLAPAIESCFDVAVFRVGGKAEAASKYAPKAAKPAKAATEAKK